jgi:hypothetical protein
VHLFLNDSFRLLGLVGPFLKILLGDTLEVIDIVEIHIVDFVDRGIEISAVADVNQEHRLLLPFAKHLIDGAGV